MIKNGWYCCPFCGKKLFPVNEDTYAHNLPFKCKGCRSIIAVNISMVEVRVNNAFRLEAVCR